MKAKLSTLLMVMVLINVVFVPAASGNENTNSDKKTLKELDYTKSELQSLYDKYNISENDIKFAKDKLPHHLKGTILNSDKRVIATKDGTPPEGLVKGEDYEKVISHDKMNSIIDQAKQDYINKYGVDPANPKVEMVNGQPLPKEEVKRLVESGEIKYSSDSTTNADSNTLSLSSSTPIPRDPYEIDNEIDTHVFIAKDDRHEPIESVQDASSNALYRFEQFGIDMDIIFYYNTWDASDISPADDCTKAIDDLRQDVHDQYILERNDIATGWLHEMDNNGEAEALGCSYSVCTDTCTGSSGLAQWPHDSIVQHEVSHHFDGEDKGTWGYEHPECIMNYEWAGRGTNIWCANCELVVHYGIDN